MGQIGRLAAEGWDGLENADALLREGHKAVRDAEAEEMRRQSRIVREALESEAGQAFLAWLKSKSIELPPTQAELTERDPAAAGLAAARRQGRDNLVWMILAALDAARGIEAKEREA